MLRDDPQIVVDLLYLIRHTEEDRLGDPSSPPLVPCIGTSGSTYVVQ